MPTNRTIDTIKRAIAAKSEVFPQVIIRPNGNHVIIFYLKRGGKVARFSLRQLINKKYKKKK